MSDKLEQLKDQIRQQLNLCDSTDTPTVCSMKSSESGYSNLEKLILQKVLYGDSISIADAIVDIENEFDRNAAE